MRRAALAACYGGGALWGIGFGMGIARGLMDRGEPLATAPSTGTSAGVWVAVATRLGTPIELLSTMEIRPPYTEAGVLEGLGTYAFGSAHAPGVRGVAVRASDLAGAELLDAGVHPAGLVAAASSAVPGLFVPVPVDGVPYVDGMMTGSCTNANLADDADRLLVIAPMASSRLPGGARTLEALEVELAAWSRRNPGATVEVWTPDAACCALIGPEVDLFDLELALTVAERAYDQVGRCGAGLTRAG